MVQYRRSGVRVQLHFLNALFEGRGGDNGQALLALFHMMAKLLPFPKARHGLGGVGPLHMDEKGVVDGIVVKPGHGAEVVKIPLAQEKLLDVLLDPGNDFFDTFLVGGSLVCHSGSSFQTDSPAREAAAIPYGADFRKLKLVFALRG